jgi:hypothetical protein
MRILVTQLPKIGYALKLPKNYKKKKITKNSHSHKEMNQTYQSIPNRMRQSPQRNESSHSCITHNSFGLVEYCWCNVGESSC